MTIELELRLEGQDANEETLLDLIDWLGDTDIEGLMVRRKELPPVEGHLGSWFDSTALIAVFIGTPPAIVAIGQLTSAFLKWQIKRNAKISLIPPVLENSNEKLKEVNNQIQTVLEEMRQKCRRKK